MQRRSPCKPPAARTVIVWVRCKQLAKLVPRIGHSGVGGVNGYVGHATYIPHKKDGAFVYDFDGI